MRKQAFASIAVGFTLLLCGQAAAQGSRNIMVTGYWPPTNEMLRSFSQSPTQNPSGWVGNNWENRGYNIQSYFPEFPGVSGPNWGRGQGDFEVDYQDASNDFWRIVNEIKPIAIITFSRGNPGASWEIESRHRKLPLNSWGADYQAPVRPTADLPIASEPDFQERQSSLPMNQIRDAVNAAGVGFSAYIDTSNSYGGTFVSEFTGYHSAWYAQMHQNPADPAWCIAGGHIHVGIDTPQAQATLAAQVTFRTLTAYLDTVIPAPHAALALLGGLGLLTRRRR